MQQVLEYFTSAGRSVGCFCDAGLSPNRIFAVLNRRPPREYGQLYRFIKRSVKAKAMRYFRADSNSRPVCARGAAQELKLVPIGPPPERGFLAQENALDSPASHYDLNLLSVVLALIVRSGNDAFDVLLAADVDGKGFKAALDCLAQQSESSENHRFDVIKVAHHGSLDSHSGSDAPLCRKDGRECIAAISAGKSRGLPDRRVLEEYLASGWTVLTTTKRMPQRYNYGFEVAAKRRNTVFQRNEIQIRWSSEEGLRWTPFEARVEWAELANYDSVLD